MYHTSDRTIVYITGVYDTLDLFTDKLREAFEKMGYGSFVYDARFGDTGKELLVDMLKPRQGDTDDGLLNHDNTQNCQGRDALDIPLDHDVPHDAPPAPVIVACVTFNNLGYNLTLPDGRNIWEACEIPYINILMDHPFHYEKPLSEAPSTSIVLCTDNNHVRYVRRYFPDIRNVDFLPHAGVELGSKHKPLSERGIDVLYAGALPIYTVGRMIPDLGAIPDVDGEKLAADVLSALVSDPDQTTECVIEDCLRERKRDISDKRIHELIVELRFLDSYATAFFREQAVRQPVSGLQGQGPCAGNIAAHERQQDRTKHYDMV
jgi:hypothetical protein